MNELVKINYETEQPTVSARDLHEKLEISKRFSAWFETNSKGFVEGQDYTSVLSGTVVNNGVVTYQYAKAKGLEGIRKEVYELFLHAEHIYKESGQGEQKLKWVVQQARGLLPQWLRIFITEDMLVKVINEWFKGVKDLLDDGKVNGSQKGE